MRSGVQYNLGPDQKTVENTLLYIFNSRFVISVNIVGYTLYR